MYPLNGTDQEQYTAILLDKEIEWDVSNDTMLPEQKCPFL